MNMIDEDGVPNISITKIKKGFTKDSRAVTYAVVRCTTPEHVVQLHELVDRDALQVVGKVVQGQYEFKDELHQEAYEELMEVGKYRKYFPKINEDGSVAMENGQLVTEPTAHPYKFGVFF
jgi:hypothetical protein